MSRRFAVEHVDLEDNIGDVASATAETTILGRFFLPYDARFVGLQAWASSVTGSSNATLDLYDQDLSTPATALPANLRFTNSNALLERIASASVLTIDRLKGRQYTLRASTIAGSRIRGLRARILIRKLDFIERTS